MKIKQPILLLLLTTTITGWALVCLSATASSQEVENAEGLGIARRGLERAKLDHNTPEAIVMEILDQKLLRHIAQAKGLQEEDLVTIKIEAACDNKEAIIYQLGANDKAFKALVPILEEYGKSRLEGHTKDFLLLAITNAPPQQESLSPHLKVLLKETSLIPVHAFKNGGTHSVTNGEGSCTTSVIYTVTDGDITWCYCLSFKADGSFAGMTNSRHDSKEFDPKYRDIIKEVDNEISEEAIKNGAVIRFGSCHSLWEQKKQKLRAKGILWRSPAELNPNCRFD
jgi:hypothetical protein